jgi:hypothetical protein
MLTWFVTDMSTIGNNLKEVCYRINGTL